MRAPCRSRSGPGAEAWRTALEPLTPAERAVVLGTLARYEQAVSEGRDS